MPLFTIDISNLLSSPIGTTEEFQFNQDLPIETFEDLVCHDWLHMNIKLIRQEYGIECLLLHIESTIEIPSEGIENKELEITNISREFHIKKVVWDPDDIQYIDIRDNTIDLANIIREELLIAGL